MLTVTHTCRHFEHNNNPLLLLAPIVVLGIRVTDIFTFLVLVAVELLAFTITFTALYSDVPGVDGGRGAYATYGDR